MATLGTWFVSGICVWLPCIKETMIYNNNNNNNNESKDRQHVSALIKFCCVLTYPPYINCDIVIAYNGDEPPKDNSYQISSIEYVIY